MTIAAIDIGSNSVRLLVVGDDGAELARDLVVTALGAGLEQTGAFNPDAYAATLRTIERYGATARRLHATDIRAVATSASRDASNGRALMADIERVLGTRPMIIDGDREARLSFAGATSDMDAGVTKLVIDVGGGSTEFVFGDTEPTYSVSVDMGSVRLTDRSIGTRPVPAGTVAEARRQADEAFSEVAVPGRPNTTIGVAGTFTSLAAIALGLTAYDPDVVHGSLLSLDTVTGLVSWLSGLSLEETASIPSLEPARARVILAGSIVVERSMINCSIGTVVVSDRGLLDGLAHEDQPVS